MLDQIVFAGAFLRPHTHNFAHRIELVIAGEDHGFFFNTPLPALAIVSLFFAFLDEHEMAEDIEKAVALQHLFPEVSAAVSGRMLRIARSALHLAGMAAAIERQKVRALPLQARGHVDFFRIGGEVHQSAFLEAEETRPRVAVRLVLRHSVPPRLSRSGILHFAGSHGQAIHGKKQINCVMLPGMAWYLPRDGELILGVTRQHFIVQAMSGLEVSHAEGLAVELEAVPQDVKHALEFQFFDQRVEQQRFQAVAVERKHLRPELRLRVLKKSNYALGKEGTFLVPLGD